jgi:hypothetical protein
VTLPFFRRASKDIEPVRMMAYQRLKCKKETRKCLGAGQELNTETPGTHIYHYKCWNLIAVNFDRPERLSREHQKAEGISEVPN